MKYKLVDVIREVEENVQFGTCDLCQHMGTLHYDILVFEDEDGNKFKEENGEWGYGDYFEYWYIDNYVDFADFIKDREYSEPCYYGDELMNSIDIVHEMYNDYQDRDC